jgi:hypothetical protein
MATKKSAPTATPMKPPAPPRRAAPETGTTNFVFYANPALTLVCVPARAPALFSLEAAAALTGVHPELLQYYCRLGVIERFDDGPAGEPTFDENALHEVRRVEHYRRHLGVCRRALPLLCELRREGERQQIELSFLCGP